MVNLVLVEPVIPMNTGNVARTCAATGSALHLVRPLGFDISDSAVKRAGLDYWNLLDLRVYRNVDEFLDQHGDKPLWLATTKAPRAYTEATFSDGCFILLGKETEGLSSALRERYRDRCIRLPMISGARSLNMANAAAILCYEALRQQGFSELLGIGEMCGAGEI